MAPSTASFLAAPLPGPLNFPPPQGKPVNETKKWIVVFLLVVLPIIGLPLMWRHPDFAPRTKRIVTAVILPLTILTIAARIAGFSVGANAPENVYRVWLSQGGQAQVQQMSTAMTLIQTTAETGDIASLQAPCTTLAEAAASAAAYKPIPKPNMQAEWETGTTAISKAASLCLQAVKTGNVELLDQFDAAVMQGQEAFVRLDALGGIK